MRFYVMTPKSALSSRHHDEHREAQLSRQAGHPAAALMIVMVNEPNVAA
jgi:hypothetical protein